MKQGLFAVDDLQTNDGDGIDQQRAAEHGKARRAEQLLPLAHGAADEKIAARQCMDAAVVAIAHDGGDRFDGDLFPAAVIAQDNAGVCALQQGHLVQALDRLREARGLDGLEQVIEGFGIEGADRVFGVGRDKNDTGGGRDVGQQVEAAFGRHRNVEEYDVGRLTRQEVDGLGEVGRFAGEINARLRLQELAQLLAGEAFVVDEDGAEAVHGVLGAIGIGSSTRTRTRPAATSVVSEALPW